MIEPAQTKLPVLIDPNPILRKKTEPFDLERLPQMQDFLSKLYKTMLEDDGVGIAAPQVGKSIRICIVSDQGQNPQILVNPEITWFSKQKITLEEGCLSVPDLFGPVERPKAVHVKAYDENGKILKLKAKGWLSRVIQHEVDHLDGILFTDKAQFIKKSESKESRL